MKRKIQLKNAGFRIALLPVAVGVALSMLASAPALAGNNTVRMGLPPWPGATIKSEVVAEILKPLGYDVKFTKASAPIVYLSLSENKVDVNLSAWSPGQAPSFEPYVKKGKIVKLGQSLTGAIAGFAVPDYVYEAGLHSDLQLPKYAQRFHYKVYCIEPGSGADNVVNKAIKQDVYGLHQWSIMHSSTAAMLAQVKRAIHKKQWITFCGWRPHWMNVALNLHYLKDPRNLWGPADGHSQVFTLASSAFVKNDPNVARFFRQFQVDAKTQSQWIYLASYKSENHQKVADRWISAHLHEVNGWLKGVTTVNGRPATVAFMTYFGS